MLLGAPLPARIERGDVLHVTVARGRRAVDAEGIVGHQLTMSPSDVTEFLGLPITTPARSWCDLAGILRLDELVAVGDYLIRRGTPLATGGELHSAALRQVSRVGRLKRMTALSLLSDRAESAAESRLRVLLVLAGFDDLLVNEPVYDDAGRFLARPDLRMRRAPVILEYEGDYHRTDRAQWMKDIARVERLQAHGWHVVRVTADDLAHPQPLLIRLKRVLAQLSPRHLRTSAASAAGIATEARN
jgi:very-short-patch-repair endonuclease